MRDFLIRLIFLLMELSKFSKILMIGLSRSPPYLVLVSDVDLSSVDNLSAKALLSSPCSCRGFLYMCPFFPPHFGSYAPFIFRFASAMPSGFIFPPRLCHVFHLGHTFRFLFFLFQLFLQNTCVFPCRISPSVSVFQSSLVRFQKVRNIPLYIHHSQLEATGVPPPAVSCQF